MKDQIDELLQESGLGDDARLRAALTEMRRTATSVVPLPSPELSAHLRRGVPRGRRRRVLITALVVTATLGAGAGTAAASPEVRDAVGHAVTSVVGPALTGRAPASVVPGPVTPIRESSPGSALLPSRSPRPDVRETPAPDSPPTGRPEPDGGAPSSDHAPGSGRPPQPGPTASHGSAQGDETGGRR